jgi:hypothetical protein
LDQHLVRGMPKLNEVAFLHRPSRSLLIADLAFNFGHDVHWLLALVMKFNGGLNRFGPSRFARSMIKDHGALRASLDRILSWDFDRIIVGHGDNVASGGREMLREAFSFVH